MFWRWWQPRSVAGGFYFVKTLQLPLHAHVYKYQTPKSAKITHVILGSKLQALRLWKWTLFTSMCLVINTINFLKRWVRVTWYPVWQGQTYAVKLAPRATINARFMGLHLKLRPGLRPNNLRTLMTDTQKFLKEHEPTMFFRIYSCMSLI